MIIIFCPNCGNQINDNEKFCSKCGNQIKQDSQDNNEQMKQSEKTISFFLILMVMIVQILFLNVGIMRVFQEIQTGMYLLYQELQQDHGLL